MCVLTRIETIVVRYFLDFGSMRLIFKTDNDKGIVGIVGTNYVYLCTVCQKSLVSSLYSHDGLTIPYMG